MENTITVAGMTFKFVYAMYEATFTGGCPTGKDYDTLEEAMAAYKELSEKGPEEVDGVIGFCSLPYYVNPYDGTLRISLSMVGKKYDLQGNCTNQEFFDWYIKDLEQSAKLEITW